MNLSATYLHSDHPHDYWTNALAASIIYDIQDEIRYRNLALQLGIAYRFVGKKYVVKIAPKIFFKNYEKVFNSEK